MKRSVLFAWHTGEEKGLLGSTYLVEHPPIPFDEMAAELQFDMIGRTRLPGDKNENLVEPGQIDVEGAGVVSSDLESIFERVNVAYLRQKLRVTADPMKEPHHWFFRSDNAAYAAGNVSILLFHDGDHVDRHLPSDTTDKIDYASMVKLLKTEYVLVATLANSQAVPLRDKPVTVEQRARLPKLVIHR